MILVLRMPDQHGAVAGMILGQAQLFLHRRPVAHRDVVRGAATNGVVEPPVVS